MKTLLREARFATLSLLCVLLSFLFFWAIMESGIHIRLGNTMDKVAKFAALSPCLIAIVLALAGLRWDLRKLPAILALLASLAGTFLIYALGG
jgi:hypothetical protein